MLNFSGQDTRNFTKTQYNYNKQKMINNLKNTYENKMNNTNLNSVNNIPKLDINNLQENYNRLTNNNSSSISSNIVNINSSNNIHERDINNIQNSYNKYSNDNNEPMIISKTENIPIPHPYPQQSKSIIKKNPLIDKDFNQNNNKHPEDLQKILNNKVKFENKTLPIPNFLKEQTLPPTSDDENKLYMAEIGDKRKLGNLIYNSILKSFKNIGKSNFTEYEINHLLQKMNLSDTNNWSNTQIKDFAKEIRSMILTNKIDNINLKPENIISESLYEKETKEISYILNINSADRDLKIWPNPNEFMVLFGPDNNIFHQEILDEKKNDSQYLNDSQIDQQYKNTGYISRSFSNISKIELLEVIFPKNTYPSKDNPNPDNYNQFPYLLVEIPELGSCYEGTNTLSSDAFATLTYSETIGNFRYYLPNKYNPIIKNYNPRIGISKMTIRIKKPYTNNIESNLFNFGSKPEYNVILDENEPEINNTDSNISNENYDKDTDTVKIKKKKNKYKSEISPNIVLIFKITCIQKSLDTMYLQ